MATTATRSPDRRGNRWAYGLLLGLLVGCGSNLPANSSLPKSAVAATLPTAPAPADNSYCLVCHVNYQEESLTTQHQTAGVGCETCHGLSAKHSADEDNLTAPEKLYSEARVAPFCLTCHIQAKLATNTNHRTVFAAPPAPPQRCTECHGEHRMATRTRRWDKDTGKLIWRQGGPTMDR